LPFSRGGLLFSTVRGSGRPKLKLMGELSLGRPLPRTVLNRRQRESLNQSLLTLSR
jgi:hypothetical protein